MKLAADRFYKGTRNYKEAPVAPVHSVPRYSYESDGRLYDVTVFHTGVIGYEVNGHPVPCGPIHRAIVEHFNIGGVK